MPSEEFSLSREDSKCALVEKDILSNTSTAILSKIAKQARKSRSSMGMNQGKMTFMTTVTRFTIRNCGDLINFKEPFQKGQ